MRVNQICNCCSRRISVAYPSANEFDKVRIKAFLILVSIFLLTTLVYLVLYALLSKWVLVGINLLWICISGSSLFLMLNGKYDLAIGVGIIGLGIVFQYRIILFPLLRIYDHFPFDTEIYLAILIFFFFLSGLTVRKVIYIHIYSISALIGLILYSILYHSDVFLLTFVLSLIYFFSFPIAVTYILFNGMNRLERLSKCDRLLLKESNHRIKNNLATLSSLISLESKYHLFSQHSVLEELRGKVDAIMLLHETMYSEDSYEEIDLSEYLKKLLNDVVGIGRTANITSNIDQIRLDVKFALEVGLIIVEFVNNSIKHAKPKGQNLLINVEVHVVNKQLSIIYRDNGAGMESVDKIKDLPMHTGLQIITEIVKYREGKIRVDSSAGFEYTIHFPLN
ncbi:hypothetical protein B4O97_17890 [Marispirochaeta aestuarii]|uniref:histidine kinase n=1 Tax=Marispirochaeta aestuarii TaxID=1963862 RepID=A0A1Y1RTE8_9SPIO|nr:sensor histidine kinase [Marispirochaeta aestuarii]ORC30710.1 hypothetical protein B4O97_17890 [Marispirochaeta aestuarii]